MPAITVKDIPRTLHRDLKARAKAHRRSLNKEVIATLEAATESDRRSAAQPEHAVIDARSFFKRTLRVAEISKWKKQDRT